MRLNKSNKQTKIIFVNYVLYLLDLENASECLKIFFWAIPRIFFAPNISFTNPQKLLLFHKSCFF